MCHSETPVQSHCGLRADFHFPLHGDNSLASLLASGRQKSKPVRDNFDKLDELDGACAPRTSSCVKERRAPLFTGGTSLRVLRICKNTQILKLQLIGLLSCMG